MGIVNDGNITGVPVTARDVKRSFDIYGKTVGGVRGRRTAHKVTAQRVDHDLKSPRGELQTMYADVAYFRTKPYVMCLSEPLGLITAVRVKSAKAMELGAAVQTHVSTI